MIEQRTAPQLLRVFSFTNTEGGWEYPGFWAVALLALALTGDGKWAMRRTGSSGSTSSH